MQKTFGLFLREKRQEKNLTQKEIAKILFVSESAVSKWEKDIAHPDITLLPKLAETLGVTEHELITASVDEESRKEKVQARKWRKLSFTWDLFFYISYILAIIPCFIVDLAVNGKFTWFWVVIAALILSFTFTNLPKFIKKYKLLLIPLSQFLALCLLLGVCAIYTNGKWFWIAVMSVFLGLVIIFAPIFIAKYPIFKKIQKVNDFVSVAVDFVVLNILLIIVDGYCISNGFATNHWYFSLALPIVVSIYLFINLLLCVRFLKTNKLIKTSVILILIDLLYVASTFLRSTNVGVQRELDGFNIFKADLSVWKVDSTLEQNVHLICFLTMLALALIFLTFGLIKYFKKKTK
jgi:transcriptional regulator with XRE-family HTH domain